MNKLKKTDDKHTIYVKRSGRHAVKDANKRWVRGDDKVAVLTAAGLVRKPEPKPAAPEPEPEAATDGEEPAAES